MQQTGSAPAFFCFLFFRAGHFFKIVGFTRMHRRTPYAETTLLLLMCGCLHLIWKGFFF